MKKRHRRGWHDRPIMQARHAGLPFGAGDVFHGAFCHAFAESGAFVAALERANEVAARSCRTPGTCRWIGG